MEVDIRSDIQLSSSQAPASRAPTGVAGCLLCQGGHVPMSPPPKYVHGINISNANVEGLILKIRISFEISSETHKN